MTSTLCILATLPVCWKNVVEQTSPSGGRFWSDTGARIGRSKSMAPSDTAYPHTQPGPSWYLVLAEQQCAQSRPDQAGPRLRTAHALVRHATAKRDPLRRSVVRRSAVGMRMCEDGEPMSVPIERWRALRQHPPARFARHAMRYG